MPKGAEDPRLKSREIQLLPEGVMAVNFVVVLALETTHSELSIKDNLPPISDIKSRSELGFEPEVASLWDQALKAEQTC